MNQNELYVDESGMTEFPLHIEQYGYINNEAIAVKNTGENIGYENVGIFIYLPLKIDFERMKTSLNRVIEENETLRAICVNHGEYYTQKILSHYKAPLDVIYAEGETKQEKLDNAIKFAIEQRKKRFNVFEEISHKEMIINISEDYNIFFIIIQHWLGDDTSLGLIWNQISRYYLEPEAETIPHVSYIDYVKDCEEYMKSPKGISQKQYWQKQMDGYKPYDTSCFSYGDAGDGWDKIYNIPMDNIQKIVKETKSTNFLVFEMALQASLSILTGRKDTMIGFISANRSLKYARTIGYVSRKIPSRLYIEENAGLREILATSVKNFSKSLLSIRGLDKTVPYQILISYQNYIVSGRKVNETFPTGFVDIPRKYPNPFMAVGATERDENLEILLLTNSDIFTLSFQKDLILCMSTLLEIMANDSKAILTDVKKEFLSRKSERGNSNE